MEVLRVEYENRLEDVQALNTNLAASWRRRRLRQRLFTFGAAAVMYVGVVLWLGVAARLPERAHAL